MIVIIGGSKGLGLSLAEEFSADNKVVTISRNQQDHSKNNIKSIKFDINKDDPSLLDKYFSKKDVSAVFFTVGLVNPSDDINLEFSEIEKINKTNFLSITKLVKFFLEKDKLKSNGLLCFCSSVTTFFSRDRQIFYASSKHALNSYTNSLRVYFYKNKISIRVSNLLLGYIDTDMSGIKYQSPFKKMSPKDLAKKIKKNYKSMNSNIIIPSYWILILFILKILPQKIILKIMQIMNIK